jgi:hypothetical protein
MRRRDALKSMAALTAAVRSPAVAAPLPQAAAEPVTDELAPLPSSQPDEAGDPDGLRFFTPEEMAAFRRLADTLLPRTRTPGALDAGAPEFLDFYIAQSGPAAQKLYREGVRRWMAGASLDPLKQPWTPEPPADPWAAFLRAAKDHLWRATIYSRAWAQAAEGPGRRRRGAPEASGAAYWYPVES